LLKDRLPEKKGSASHQGNIEVWIDFVIRWDKHIRRL